MNDNPSRPCPLSVVSMVRDELPEVAISDYSAAYWARGLMWPTLVVHNRHWRMTMRATTDEGLRPLLIEVRAMLTLERLAPGSVIANGDTINGVAYERVGPLYITATYASTYAP